MKNIIIFLFAILIFGCKPEVQPSTVVDTSKDSTIAALNTKVNELRDSVLIANTNEFNAVVLYDSKVDSLRSRVFVLNFCINRLAFYGNICARNPSQTVFLKGWQNRAMNGKKIILLPVLKDSIDVFLRQSPQLNHR